VLPEVNGGEIDIGMACWAGGGMFPGEDMGVKSKEGWKRIRIKTYLIDFSVKVEGVLYGQSTYAHSCN
jgi:hypothetical protein